MPPIYLEPPLRTATVGDRTMAWREAGHGGAMPLVLLHGIGSNARAWAGQFAGFASERRVVAWNAPGYAGSDPLDQAWPAPGDYAASCIALLDLLGIDRCVLIGQSLGAVMATAVAKDRPERVAALVLASPASGYRVVTGAPLPAGLTQRIKEVVRLGPAGLAAARAGRLLTAHATPDARALVHRAMAEVVPHGYTQAVRLLAVADLPRNVAGLTMATMVLWGAEDMVTPPEGCRTIAGLAGGMAAEIPGVGHAFATEAPGLFNDAVRPLIAAVDAHAAERTDAWI